MARIEDLPVYVRKVTAVFAVQVTEFNIDEVAQLLSGAVYGTCLPPEERSVRFHICGEEFDAAVGEYVTWQGGDILIYPADEFDKFFQLVNRTETEEEEDYLANALISEFGEGMDEQVP